MPSTHTDPGYAAAVMELSPDTYVVAGPDGRIEWVSPQVRELLGHRPESLVGRDIEAIVPVASRTRHQHLRPVHVSDRPTEPQPGRIYAARHRDGRNVPVDLRIRPFDGGRVLGVLRDASEQAREMVRLTELAERDELTGLANRRALLAGLEGALARARRRQDLVGVAFLDLDDFKSVNDRFGHEAGDIVLKHVAAGLAHVAREHDLVGRLGGDEFVVCLESLGASPAEAGDRLRALLERMRREIDEPIRYAGRTLHVGVSIGVALSDGSDDAHAVLRHADEALYRSKATPRVVAAAG